MHIDSGWLDVVYYFHNTGIMEQNEAVVALGALAQPTRLEVFRLLVQAGPAGRAAGEIAAALDVPANTLSFHLKGLAAAHLVQSRQEGRFVIYVANFEAMGGLIAFLTENCCAGASCEASAAATACQPQGACK